MKRLLENWNKFLSEDEINESSLSRIYQHIMEHECVILTAYRGNPSDASRCAGDALGLDMSNPERNNRLKDIIMNDLGYGPTSVDGSYIEDFGTDVAKEVKEPSFFVQNFDDNTRFLGLMAGLGKSFCQDSILVIPQGGENCYLLGTNNTDFPGYKNKEVVGDIKFGSEAEFMSRVGGRPFRTGE
tara:strand:- start:48 stop:602 length:555 start_codon:yes stop_codon:yes gene_type:complete